MRVSSLLVFVCIFSLALSQCPDDDPSLTRWSTWSGKPTADNQNVVVPASLNLLIDESPRRLGLLDIYGYVYVKHDVNITIVANTIYVRTGALFQAGCATCPYTANLNIALYGAQAFNVNPDGVGTKVLGVFPDGNLRLHGVLPSPTWTVLAQTANAGATSITLRNAPDWRAGDRIVIATTDYEYTDQVNYPASQNEIRTVVSVSGNVVQLDRPLTYMHYGRVWTGSGGHEVDMAAEVGVLNRNIKFYGDTADTAANAVGWGAHIMMLPRGEAYITAVELTNVGQRGEKGRYPIHFHLHNNPSQSHVIGCSIHNTFQRCLTLHGARDILVKDNVAYNGTGHCYFIEDGNEVENIFQHNLGISPRRHDLLVADSQPSVFWIVNPRNHFYDNAAVGGAFGYWYAMPDVPTGPVKPPVSPDYAFQLRFTPMGDFDSNRAHSSAKSGLFIDDGQKDDQGNTDNSSYLPSNWTSTLEFYRNDTNASISLIRAAMTTDGARMNLGFPQYGIVYNFTAFKCLDRGIWGRGRYVWVYGAKLADNVFGYTYPGQYNLIQRSVFVGETDNIGTPGRRNGRQWWPNEEGRSRPNKNWLEMPIIGYSSYDAGGGDIAINNVFYNYVDYQFTNATGWPLNQTHKRSAAAFSGLPGPNVIEPHNKYFGNTFFNVTNRVFLTLVRPGTRGVRGPYIDDNMPGWVAVDVDGTLTGTCGNVVVGTSPILRNSSCTLQSNWNAYVCPPGGVPHRPFTLIGDDTIFVAGSNRTLLYQNYRARLTRLIDGAFIDVYPGVDGYTATTDYMYFEYGTNLMANQDYMVTVNGQLPNKFTISVRNQLIGEYTQFALPFPAGTTFTGTYSGSTNALLVANSKAQLNGTNYFFDTATNLLWIRLRPFGYSFDYPYGLPVGLNSDARMTITATCPGNPSICSQTAPSAASLQASATVPFPSRNLCESNGPPATQASTYGSPTASYTIFGFGNGSLHSEWRLENETVRINTCGFVDGIGATGLPAIACDMVRDSNRDDINPIRRRQFTNISLAAYTHLSVDIRSAPGYGPVFMSVQVSAAGGAASSYLPLADPNYTNLRPIDETWRTIRVPLTAFNIPAGTGNLYQVTFNRAGVSYGRPYRVYIDNLQLVAVTQTRASISFPTEPAAPPAISGPGRRGSNPTLCEGGYNPTPPTPRPSAPITGTDLSDDDSATQAVASIVALISLILFALLF